MPRKITKNALPISFDRVRQPSAAVRVVPLYQMGRRVAYLCVAFPCHIAKVHEKFVNFERIFLYEPCHSMLVGLPSVGLRTINMTCSSQAL